MSVLNQHTFKETLEEYFDQDRNGKFDVTTKCTLTENFFCAIRPMLFLAEEVALEHYSLNEFRVFDTELLKSPSGHELILRASTGKNYSQGKKSYWENISSLLGMTLGLGQSEFEISFEFQVASEIEIKANYSV